MNGTAGILAAVTFHNPSSIVGWIIVGLIAGWAASHVMGDGGFGVIGDVIVGLIGAVIGGVIIGFIWAGTTGFIGSIVVAFIGACVLIWLIRMLSGGRAAARV
ncbi:MAG TPA: GlsB/YeaQ/YmgE family stress response membrane protein [Chloroflexota bacterium]|nr:GlsB/YeaQ/YmgE family stress response membrane protein [Chloroflexota bacterium]